MEIFVDFGLFELLAAAALTRLGKALYSRRGAAVLIMCVSIGAPLCLLFLVEEGAPRWLAALVLATAVLNVSLVAECMRAGGFRSAERINSRMSRARPAPAGGSFRKESSGSES